MHKYLWVAAIALLITGNSSSLYAATPWGENYFPNVPLITHEGKTVHFFEDLIKDKVVVINFIYTHCPDSCPLETAQLARVQKIMGDRLGKDVFFYSITVDPENDTPAALKEYRKRFKARWTFLTGKNEDIILLRKKLGLYIEEIQDGSNNHNVSLIIGNQTTGRWMKRSPFENPHVLADQIGNWLTGWKTATVSNDYTNAPKLRNISRGEQMFRTRCATCHTLTGHELAEALGPDLLNINKRRDKQWLLNWLKAPDQMLEKKDPIAIALYKKYNNLVMPNMRLNKEEAQSLLEFISDETQRLQNNSDQTASKVSASVTPTVTYNEASGAVIEVLNSWILATHPTAKANAGYMTLKNSGSEDVTLIKMENESFDNIEVHEMTVIDGLMEMHKISNLVIPAKGQMQFEPGGKHLMLKGPHEHLSKGQTVDMILTFKSGKKQTVSINVAAR